jgi:hypothetical protein
MLAGALAWWDEALVAVIVVVGCGAAPPVGADELEAGGSGAIAK